MPHSEARSITEDMLRANFDSALKDRKAADILYLLGVSFEHNACETMRIGTQGRDYSTDAHSLHHVANLLYFLADYCREKEL